MTPDSDSSKASFPQNLPDYTYVPGISTHPVSDSLGHAFGAPHSQPTGSLCRGEELFNHGYYWEAHEAWEAEWHAAGRTSPRAKIIKGLIKLAACGVKCLERNPTGAQRHARRAAELLRPDENALDLDFPADLLCQLREISERLLQDSPMATLEQQQSTRHAGVPILGKLPDLFKKI